MHEMISFLVDREANIYAQNGVCKSWEIAKIFGINQRECLVGQFDLVNRVLYFTDSSFRVMSNHASAAKEFFTKCAGTPESLIAFVERGNWDGNVLPLLLNIEARRLFFLEMEPTRKLQLEAIELARNVHEEAIVNADMGHQEAVDLARKKYTRDQHYLEADTVYDRSVISAKKSRRESELLEHNSYDEAVESARKAYNETAIKIWTQFFRDVDNRIKIWCS